MSDILQRLIEQQLRNQITAFVHIENTAESKETRREFGKRVRETEALLKQAEATRRVPRVR